MVGPATAKGAAPAPDIGTMAIAGFTIAWGVFGPPFWGPCAEFPFWDASAGQKKKHGNYSNMHIIAAGR